MLYEVLFKCICSRQSLFYTERYSAFIPGHIMQLKMLLAMLFSGSIHTSNMSLNMHPNNVHLQHIYLLECSNSITTL